MAYMQYRVDSGLDFLEAVKSEDLNDLVYCLTHDKDGEKRIAEELTSTDDYELYYPDHHQYWQLIVAEIQTFGANTFATVFRGGKGVLYKEILIDVCDKLKVNYNKNSNVEQIETNLLMKILTDAIDKMSKEELVELAKAAGVKNTSNLNKQIMVGVFQAVFRAGGFKSYQLTVIIANAILKALIGRGLAVAGNATLTRTMAILTGPIGWVITGLWTAVDIAGPAYRVTIPTVIQVSVLRQKILYEQHAEHIEFS